MFMSAASYAQIRKVLKRERLRETEMVIDQIDKVIATNRFLQDLSVFSACKGPNGERLMFIPMEVIKP